MKRAFLLLALSGLTLAALAQTDTYTLQGTVADTKTPGKVYLRYKLMDSAKVDSAEISKGQFVFSGVAAAQPVEASLILTFKDTTGKNRQAGRMLFLEPGTIQVFIAADWRKMVVKGKTLNNDFDRYQQEISGVVGWKDSLNAVLNKYSREQFKADTTQKKIQGYIAEYVAALRASVTSWIERYPNALASLMILKNNGGAIIDPDRVEPLFLKLSSAIRSSEAGKDYAEKIDIARRLAIGKTAPAFTQSDTAGKLLSLTDLRGQYVLLDFWASWCGPCRAENPNVVAVYNKYKDRKFTVLSVSLDMPGKKDSWLKAIHNDGLSWYHVSDLKYWNNAVAVLYDVKAVPQNYLIAPDGKIIAKNLRGEELGAKLAELLGK